MEKKQPRQRNEQRVRRKRKKMSHINVKEIRTRIRHVSKGNKIKTHKGREKRDNKTDRFKGETRTRS